MTVATASLDNARAPAHYDGVYRALHWTIAILFIAAVAIGFRASLIPPGQGIRPALLEVHKALGMTVLLLAIVRLGYRLSVRPPALPASVGPVTRFGSASAHWILYALMLFMPVTGYVFSTAGGHGVSWFGLFQFPRLIGRNHDLSKFNELLHARGAWVIYAILGLHIVAALWHAIRRDGIVERMTRG